MIYGNSEYSTALRDQVKAQAKRIAELEQAVREAVPECYTLRVIEALNENGDPVSVDAAEEIRRLLGLVTAHPKAQPMTREQIQEMLTAHFDDDTLAGDDMTLIRAVERHHKIGE